MTERQADQKWVEDTRAEYLRRAVSHPTKGQAYPVMWLKNEAPGYVSGTLGAPAGIAEGVYALVPITEEQVGYPAGCLAPHAVLRVEPAEFGSRA